MSDTKECRMCHAHKPHDEFHKDPKSGKPRGRCKVCYNADIQVRRAMDPEKVREINRRYLSTPNGRRVTREAQKRWHDRKKTS